MAHEFKRILIGLLPSDEGGGATTPAVDYGIGLAGRFGGSVTFHVFVPRVSAPYSAVGGFAGGIVATENKRRRDLIEATAAAAAAAADAAGIAHAGDTPDLGFDELTERLGRLARLHDATVFDAGDTLLGDNRHVIEEALFNSGRPVIVVPRSGGSTRPGRISIAWDGSARSARAVADAVPLLRSAQKTSVVIIGGEKDLSRAASGEDLLAYLAAHDVAAELVKLQASGGDVAATLRRQVAESGSEMIVMGAFVHSRFRQAILGGVTRSLLQDSPVPLLLAH